MQHQFYLSLSTVEQHGDKQLCLRSTFVAILNFFPKQLGFLFKYLITCTELGRQCRPVATTTRAVLLLRKLQEMNVFMSDERQQIHVAAGNAIPRWIRRISSRYQRLFDMNSAAVFHTKFNRTKGSCMTYHISY